MTTGIIAIGAGIAMGAQHLESASDKECSGQKAGKHGQAAGSSWQRKNSYDRRYGNHGNHRRIDIRNSDCFGG